MDSLLLWVSVDNYETGLQVLLANRELSQTPARQRTAQSSSNSFPPYVTANPSASDTLAQGCIHFPLRQRDFPNIRDRLLIHQLTMHSPVHIRLSQ